MPRVRATFSWSPTPNADGYRLYHGDDPIGTYASPGAVAELEIPYGPVVFGVEAFNQTGFGPRRTIVRRLERPSPGEVEGFDVTMLIIAGGGGGSGGGGGGEFDASSLLLWDQQTNAVSPDESAPLSIYQSNETGTGSGWTGSKVSNGAQTWSSSPGGTGTVDGTAATSEGNGGSPSHAHGFIYTVDPSDIAEFSGVIPGFVSRAYVFESWADTMDGQEDFFLFYGDPEGAAEQIPGDVWFQFWYFKETDVWENAFGHPKFIYPNRSTYPAQDGNIDWLVSRYWNNHQPFPSAMNDHGERYVNWTADTGTLNYPSTGDSGTNVRIGQTVLTPSLDEGVWTCVRLHMNASSAAQAGGRCKLQAYMRTYGTETWTLVADWTEGQSPNPDPDSGAYTFEYNVDGPTNGYGHKVFITPANVSAVSGPFANSRYFMSDIAMCAGVDSGGAGESAFPDFSDYGY